MSFPMMGEIEWRALSWLERDAEVARRVMGICPHRELWGKPPRDQLCSCGIKVFQEQMEDERWVPPFTRDLGLAFEVVERIAGEDPIGFRLIRVRRGDWEAELHLGPDHVERAAAATAAEAICIAALAARGYQVWT